MGRQHRPTGNKTPDANLKLAHYGLPHLPMILDEVFAVAPPGIFPEISYPQTLGELAAYTGQDLLALHNQLEAIANVADPIEITPEELAEARTQRAGWLLLDVREPWEFAIAHIEGSILLAECEFATLLPRLQAADAVITICHHGVRSLSAALALRAEGVPKARSLAGGVEAWATQIDPSMAHY